jgi:DNA (cytosine-5)-methyltransferase 3A
MKQIKMKSYHVLSLFDGISCGLIALKQAGHNVASYKASEIEPEAVIITTARNPQVQHVGDVRNLKGENYKNVDVVFGGSPCQGFSKANKKTGVINDEDLYDTYKKYLQLKLKGYQFKTQSYLFWEFYRLYLEIKAYNPNVKFLLENVEMSEKWEKIITKCLGVEPIRINSSRLTAQNRERLYWTNIPGVTIPEDKHIYLDDVIPGAKCYSKNGYDLGNKKPDGSIKWEQVARIRKDNKANCITTKRSNNNKLIFPDGTIRHYTVNEAELLQGLPAGYTDVPGISMTKRYKAVGNAWTVPVIAHILKFLKK